MCWWSLFLSLFFSSDPLFFVLVHLSFFFSSLFSCFCFFCSSFLVFFLSSSSCSFSFSICSILSTTSSLVNTSPWKFWFHLPFILWFCCLFVLQLFRKINSYMETDWCNFTTAFSTTYINTYWLTARNSWKACSEGANDVESTSVCESGKALTSATL